MVISGHRCLTDVAIGMDYERAIIFAVNKLRMGDPLSFNEVCVDILRKGVRLTQKDLVDFGIYLISKNILNGDQYNTVVTIKNSAIQSN